MQPGSLVLMAPVQPGGAYVPALVLLLGWNMKISTCPPETFCPAMGTQPFSFMSESAGKTTPCEYSLKVCVMAQVIEPGVPMVMVHFSMELPLVSQITESSKRSQRGSSEFSLAAASKAEPEITTFPLKSNMFQCAASPLKRSSFVSPVLMVCTSE